MHGALGAGLLLLELVLKLRDMLLVTLHRQLQPVGALLEAFDLVHRRLVHLLVLLPRFQSFRLGIRGVVELLQVLVQGLVLLLLRRRTRVAAGLGAVLERLEGLLGGLLLSLGLDHKTAVPVDLLLVGLQFLLALLEVRHELVHLLGHGL